jgi:hypothetical protein
LRYDSAPVNDKIIMTQEDRDFCQANIINFESVALGFTRNIDHSILNEYTRIYQRSLDANFILNAWCGSCVFDMLKRLKAHYDSQPTNQTNDEITAPRTRGRKPKLGGNVS